MGVGLAVSVRRGSDNTHRAVSPRMEGVLTHLDVHVCTGIFVGTLESVFCDENSRITNSTTNLS